MELTNRQIYIISYLLNHPEGMNADHLAAQAEISLRTLQMEIKEINDSLKDGGSIVRVGKHGYAVQNFSEKARETILAEAEDRQTMLMPEQRVNDILSTLIFEKDYISMEALANKLFLSKGTVFRTIESSAILKKTITVNKSKGLRIELPEFEKRQYLTKVFDKESASLYAPDAAVKYKGLDQMLRSYLPKLFVSHKYHVSGEALRSFRRYMILSIIRSSAGYVLEDIDHELEISALMKEILDITRSVTGVNFSESEIQDLQAKLNELPTFLIDVPESRRKWMEDWEPEYQRFIQELKKEFNINIDMPHEEKLRFILHINKLYQRVAVGHHNSNYNKREINRTYPLATQLIICCFEKAFGFKVPETEVTFLALYLALPLRYRTEPVNCKIVTSKHPSLVWPMKKWLEEHFEHEIGQIDVIEHYLWLNKKLNKEYNLSVDDSLILTASASMALSCPQAVLIKPFALDNEYNLISSRIKDICNRHKNHEFSQCVKSFVSAERIIDDKAKKIEVYEDLLSVLGMNQRETGCLTDDDYEFILDTDVFLIPYVFAYRVTGQNNIKIYYLDKPLSYRGSNLRAIVVSRYYACSNEMIRFYNCISELLRPGRVDELKQSLIES